MAIYRALGVENIRHRRKARNSVLMRRLLSLDFVLEHPGLNWLPTEPEKDGTGMSVKKEIAAIKDGMLRCDHEFLEQWGG